MQANLCSLWRHLKAYKTSSIWTAGNFPPPRPDVWRSPPDGRHPQRESQTPQHHTCRLSGGQRGYIFPQWSPSSTFEVRNINETYHKSTNLINVAFVESWDWVTRLLPHHICSCRIGHFGNFLKSRNEKKIQMKKKSTMQPGSTWQIPQVACGLPRLSETTRRTSRTRKIGGSATLQSGSFRNSCVSFWSSW